MGSYLAEVLSSVEEMEVEEINTKYPDVAARAETCKSEVLSYLENVYVKFIERPKRNKALANKVKQIQDELSDLINNVENITRKELTNAEHEMQQNLNSLVKVEMALSLIDTLNSIHEALTIIKELREEQDYFKCMEEILKTEEMINGLQMDKNLPVLEELSENLSTEKASLLDHVSNVFKDSVICKVEENRSIIKIDEDNNYLSGALLALHFYKSSVTPLDAVTRFVWNHILVPIVDFTTKVEVSTNNNISALEMTVIDDKKKSSYVEVFANIKTVLQFLMENFDIPLNEDLTTLSYIGRDIRDNLSELIIKHCLQDTIPSTDEGLQQYKVVIEATEELEKTLVASKIFAEDTTSILKYANNIDVLFINKKCQDYVVMAQELMKKDLHNMIQVGKSQTSESSLEVFVEFPQCSISQNVVDLLKLLEKILIEATTVSAVCAGRLFCIVETICQKYITFVPEHHKKFLQTIPQQIALFYNNCMYISYKLYEWNTEYLEKLPSLLNISPNSFEDQGRQLRAVATEKFTSYVDSQIKQIEEIMKEADLQRQTLEQIKPATEKCVRQCLRQQELLKTVWHKVLPYTTYNKTLGVILNSLCNYMVNAIVKLEDISSDAAEHLVELFKMIQTRGPKLFTDPKEVSLFVSSWYKVDELAFVLNASLLDINDRWADGKGPLALQFKVEELRQLVKALFQNTERRAALLAKIHD